MVSAIDCHAGGEPGRVIVGGVIDLPGNSMYEKMTHLRDRGDGLRERMLREPRGYPAANCNLILPPTIPNADVGLIVMEQTEYPAMSGSNVICAVTAIIETGIIPAREPETTLTLETPAGLIPVRATVSDGKVTLVTFENVPAFATHLDVPLEVPHVGNVDVDVAWGGMFFVIVDVSRFGYRLEPNEGRELARVGQLIKAAAARQIPVLHPELPGVAGITQVQLTATSADPLVSARNVVVDSTGQLDWSRPEEWAGVIDRSPCGTGTCARMATLHARGLLGLHEKFVQQGILGTVFTGELVRETTVGPYRAVVPTLSGEGWITGFAQYVVDPSDPFPNGYTVGDLWGYV